MNWENKFSTIVQETEANLAKVKEKLRGKSSYAAKSISFDDYSPRSSSLSSQFPVSSTPKSHLSVDRYTPSFQTSSPSNLQLQDKIDEQTKTIAELTRLVRNFDKERGDYQKQIRELRHEVSQLSGQVMESRTTPHLEWQMDQMKRSMMREVQEVRDQLKVFRNRVDRHSASDRNTSNSFTKDIDDVRHDIQEELQYVKKDLDVLRRRLGSVEMGVRSSHYDKREFERSHDRMSKSLREMSSGRSNNLVDILRTCPDADPSPAHLQLNQLRGTVRHLKDKLDSVETRLHTSPPKMEAIESMRNGHTRESVKSYEVDVESDSDFDDLDEDDLSLDLDDSDIEISVTQKMISKGKTVRKMNSSPELSVSDDDVGALDSDDLDVDNDLDMEDFNIEDTDDDIDV